MTALKLAQPLATEFGLLIQRLAEPIMRGDGLTAEETLDLRAWLRAARERHWQELREARANAASAEIVNFRAVEKVMGDGRRDLPSRRADQAGAPCDSEPAA